MAGMIEVAQATVTIIPTMQGAQQTITKELTDAGDSAGTSAGKSAGKSMVSSMSSTMSKAGGALTKSVTAPLLAVGAASVAAWKEVDSGLDTIVEKTGASGAALESMSDILDNIATSVPTDFATAGAAIGEVNTRFGSTGKELEKLSTQFVKFAKLNNTDVSKSIDTVQKALSVFGKTADEAPKLLDALTAAGQKTGASVDILANGLIQNGTAFEELGLDIYQATMFMGQMEISGANSETVMQGLRKALKNAAKDGIPLNKALSNLQNSILKGKNGMDGLTAAYELFGKSGDQIYGAVKNGTLDFTNLAVATENLEGTVSKTFEGTLSPLENFTTVLNQLKTVGADLVVSAGPALTSMLGTVSNIVKSLSDAWNDLSPKTQETIVKFGLFAAAAGPVLSVGGKLLGGVQKLGGVFSKLGGGLSGLTSKLGSFGSSASTAASGAASATSSFSSMAGQAVQLVATGAAILLIASGIALLSQSAIALADAGPLAIGVLVGLSGVAVGMTAAIVAIGAASTASSVGLLAMGAAVLMVSAGISLIVVSLALFCTQLPTVAQYGGSAALAIVELAGGMSLMAGAAVLLTTTLVPLAVQLGVFSLAMGATELSMVALLVELGLVAVELLVMDKALGRVKNSMSNIASSARSATNDIKYMVSAVDVVGQFLGGLKDKADKALGFVSSLFSQKTKDIKNVAQLNMASVNSTLTFQFETAKKQSKPN